MSLSLMKDKKIVMVGLDIRNPKLSEYLSISSNKGMTSFMASDTMKPEDIIIQSGLHPNLYVIPAGPIPPNPAELLLSERLEEMFTYLRGRFDYIVVDTAPVGMVSDTFTLNRISDATIYLCRANYTNKSHLKFIESVVAGDRLKKLSLVINGTTTKTGYGYGYGDVRKSKKGK
jgi:capsular exopolysaccharide synthesis family protein